MDFKFFFLVLFAVIYVTRGDEYHPRKTHKSRDKRSIDDPIHTIPYANWDSIALESLNRVLNHRENKQRAKNVIFFLGDGMGISTLTTARLHIAQKERLTLDKSHLAWDHWPGTALIKTYNSDASTPDSAGTATAFNCGQKARMGTVGVKEDVEYEKCSTMSESSKCKSALHMAMEQGKWGGIVTTARITHATPAAAFSHSPSREWEHLTQVPEEDRDRCEDIAKQLIHTEINKDLKVLLGGGRSYFMKQNETDPEYPNRRGTRPDRSLIDDWRNFKEDRGIDRSKMSYVTNKAQFDNINPRTTDYLLGLFEPSHMQYELDRVDNGREEPSLAEMVEKSINLLSRGPSGYFLYAEAGRIDHAHHDANAKRALADTVAFSEAVEKAVQMTNSEETLIVVTADHSHVFTIGGYSNIDTPLYGAVHNVRGEMSVADDGVPYLMLGYANGPGHTIHRSENNTRRDLRLDSVAGDYDNKNYLQDALVPLQSETHGGEDVMAYAQGPWSHLFKGTQEQNYIAHALMYSACLGSYSNRDHCTGYTSSGDGIKSSPLFAISLISLVFMLIATNQ